MIQIFVNGEPKAQPRPRASRRGSKTVIYTPPSADSWKKLVKKAFANHEDTYVKGQSLSICLHFFFKRPVSHRKKNGDLRKGINAMYVQKPDFDNLAKAVVDAIGDAGVWHDDCQIVKSIITKQWSHYEGCDVKIERASA